MTNSENILRKLDLLRGEIERTLDGSPRDCKVFTYLETAHAIINKLTRETGMMRTVLVMAEDLIHLREEEILEKGGLANYTTMVRKQCVEVLEYCKVLDEMQISI